MVQFSRPFGPAKDRHVRTFNTDVGLWIVESVNSLVNRHREFHDALTAQSRDGLSITHEIVDSGVTFDVSNGDAFGSTRVSVRNVFFKSYHFSFSGLRLVDGVIGERLSIALVEQVPQWLSDPDNLRKYGRHFEISMGAIKVRVHRD